jgi:DNA polymerase-3 subunit alpha
MGYAGYFLIVQDFVHYAKEKGIPVGPGRGSVAGSLAAYALEITDIDPLEYGLLFERFLNPGRIGMPDIDLDFADDRRDEIIDYVRNKYGESRVSQIITFGTMAARGVIRDVGRVLNIPYGEVDKIAKMIPLEASTLAEALETVPELREIEKREERYKQLIDTAKILEGLARHASTHAAGVVISRDDLINYTPFYKDAKDKIATQYAMGSLEAVGLLKMDFLGLRNLTVIEETLNLIKETQGKQINLRGIPLNDKKTYTLLKEARTIGVFQLESSGFRDLLRKMEPGEFEDIIALMALHRPGALNSGMTDDYIACKKGLKAVKYSHPRLEPILKETYGTILYQEQVMRTASDLGGFTPEQADDLRRAMGKKIPEIMAEQRQTFLAGAAKNGIKEEKANETFDLMAHFAGYGFNKSHSAGYALISYRTAYLKANYPIEYMAALLSSEVGDTDKIALYIRECRKMKVKVLPPEINRSFAHFTVKGKNIQFGLAAVKNVGEGAIASIIKGREKGKFTSLYDFCERVDSRIVNKKTIESLIKCGTFDSLKKERAFLAATLDKALGAAQQVQKDRSKGQISLFEEFEKDEKFLGGHEEVEEWPENRRLAYEKEVLGLYLSGHPLARFEKELKRYASTSTSELSKLEDGEQVNIGGMIEKFRTKNTKNGKRMAFLQFEDLEGSVEIIVWPETFRKFASEIKSDSLALIKGRVDTSGEQAKVISEEIIPLSQMRKKLAKSIHVKISTAGLTEDILANLKDILLDHKGDCPTYLHLETIHHGEVVVELGSPQFLAGPSDKLITEVEKLLGEESIWFN